MSLEKKEIQKKIEGVIIYSEIVNFFYFNLVYIKFCVYK